jgi:hypothetical protein
MGGRSITVEGLDEEGYVIHEEEVRGRHSTESDIFLDRSKAVNARRIIVHTLVAGDVWEKIENWNLRIELLNRK